MKVLVLKALFVPFGMEKLSSCLSTLCRRRKAEKGQEGTPKAFPQGV
ncbi:MAG: hypothetical protein PHN80_16425 [Hespellia sp.]|nr:hypothetical protein [Hespellia sp.]